MSSFEDAERTALQYPGLREQPITTQSQLQEGEANILLPSSLVDHDAHIFCFPREKKEKLYSIAGTRNSQFSSSLN
jgi:hypothetical protein